jgi:hypothetical protein
MCGREREVLIVKDIEFLLRVFDQPKGVVLSITDSYVNGAGSSCFVQVV